jgi:hypothetical protein
MFCRIEKTGVYGILFTEKDLGGREVGPSTTTSSWAVYQIPFITYPPLIPFKDHSKPFKEEEAWLLNFWVDNTTAPWVDVETRGFGYHKLSEPRLPISLLLNLDPHSTISIRPPHPLPALKPLQLPNLRAILRHLQRLFARQPRRLAMRRTNRNHNALLANRTFAEFVDDCDFRAGVFCQDFCEQQVSIKGDEREGNDVPVPILNKVDIARGA